MNLVFAFFAACMASAITVFIVGHPFIWTGLIVGVIAFCAVIGVCFIALDWDWL